MENDIEVELGWLVIPPQETMLLTVDMTTLQERIKHFSARQRRFYACQGQGCDFCRLGTPKRMRYQVHVTFNGNWWWWEIGKELYRRIMGLVGDDPSAQLLVTRIGDGRRTHYWITRVGESCPLPVKERVLARQATNKARR